MKNEKEKSNGITLVSLVVTIILLLILSGITIVGITGENGILKKVIMAKNKDSESSTKEKLQLKIYELQTDIIKDENREATLSDLNRWIDPSSSNYDKEIINIIDKSKSKLVYIGKHIFEVDENLDIISTLNETDMAKIEATYRVNSTTDKVMQVTIKVVCNVGIEKVITPDGIEKTPQTTNKDQIEFDYEVTEGYEYRFKIKTVGSDKQKEYVLKVDNDSNPEIIQGSTGAYPNLSGSGIQMSTNVKVDYGESINNYYSIDDGKTWNEYTGDINITEECNLVVKTVIEGQITREDSEKITMEPAKDAIGSEAYDGNEETGYINKDWNYTGRYIYLKVDSSAIYKKININYYNTQRDIYIVYLDSDKNKIHDYTLNTTTNTNQNAILYNIIPEGTEWIAVYNTGYSDSQVTIYEISIIDEPIVRITKNGMYPTWTANGIEPSLGYNKVKIEYDNSSVKKLYSFDKIDWKEYKDEEIQIKYKDTLYAKGINEKGEETLIGQYTENNNPEEAVNSVAYDGDEGTLQSSPTNKYINISHELWGKELKVVLNTSYTDMHSYKIGVNANIKINTLLSMIRNSGTYYATIPENTDIINIYGSSLCEIGIKE